MTSVLPIVQMTLPTYRDWNKVLWTTNDTQITNTGHGTVQSLHGTVQSLDVCEGPVISDFLQPPIDHCSPYVRLVCRRHQPQPHRIHVGVNTVVILDLVVETSTLVHCMTRRTRTPDMPPKHTVHSILLQVVRACGGDSTEFEHKYFLPGYNELWKSD